MKTKPKKTVKFITCSICDKYKPPIDYIIFRSDFVREGAYHIECLKREMLKLGILTPKRK